jgi:hypothetical protein
MLAGGTWPHCAVTTIAANNLKAGGLDQPSPGVMSWTTPAGRALPHHPQLLICYGT